MKNNIPNKYSNNSYKNSIPVKVNAVKTFQILFVFDIKNMIRVFDSV